MDERGVLDLDDDTKTENTRAAYKLEQIANHLPTKRAGHPVSVVMLTADAFGVLPPIARLTREQALFYFLSGYTAKVAGTEIGVTEPQATFSACFGAPFLPQSPGRVRGAARRAARRPRLDGLAREHRLDGRPVRRGRADADRAPRGRCSTRRSRASSRAARSARIEVFGFEVPDEVPGVETSLLDPRSTWRDPDAYDEQARSSRDVRRQLCPVCRNYRRGNLRSRAADLVPSPIPLDPKGARNA